MFYSMKDQIIKIIYSSIEEINTSNILEVPILKQEDSLLWGPDSNLDSIGQTSLLLSIENAINFYFKVEVSLAEESAFFTEKNHFRDVRALANYIEILITKQSL